VALGCPNVEISMSVAMRLDRNERPLSRKTVLTRSTIQRRQFALNVLISSSSTPDLVSRAPQRVRQGWRGSVACSPSDQSSFSFETRSLSSFSPPTDSVYIQRPFSRHNPVQPSPLPRCCCPAAKRSSARVTPAKPTKIPASRRPSAHARCIAAIEKGSRPTPPTLL
jgi:hypothetical protein